MTSTSQMMPALFISHGTPMQALRDNDFTRAWAELGERMPRPSLILSISAHWLTRGGVLISGNARPPVIYDMGGFPEELYRVQYPAEGSPGRAEEVTRLVTSVPVRLSEEWGYDHGTWVVLSHMYPEADIPVIQLSVNMGMPESGHFQLGQQLAALRQQGVLVMGTGQFVHNLRMMASRTDEPMAFPWASEFSETVSHWIDQREFDKVVAYRSLGKLAEMAHPSPDHFLPLLTILGMVTQFDRLRWINKTITGGSIDMRSLVIEPD